MPRNRRLGAEAEDRAAEFLQELGYTLVTRNYHAKSAEIDAVAMDGDTLVFIEVRERQSDGWEGPEESISATKQKRLWQAAEHYMAHVLGREAGCRFDVIAIQGDELRHHKDAFRP